MTQARFLRVLEYSGDLEWCLEQIKARTVKGEVSPRNGCFIREAMIGEVPELLKDTTKQGTDNE